MSIKNSFLLRKSGRDQFDITERPSRDFEGKAVQYSSYDIAMVDKHYKLNEEFVIKYKEQWLRIFADLNRKEVWNLIHPLGTISLGTFYRHVLIHDTLDDFLCYQLVRNKRKALALLGFEETEIMQQLRAFKDCGRYFVTFGKGSSFGTFVSVTDSE